MLQKAGDVIREPTQVPYPEDQSKTYNPISGSRGLAVCQTQYWFRLSMGFGLLGL